MAAMSLKCHCHGPPAFPPRIAHVSHPIRKIHVFGPHLIVLIQFAVVLIKANLFAFRLLETILGEFIGRLFETFRCVVDNKSSDPTERYPVR